MNILAEKFKEVLSAVFPITIIVLILNFTITPLENHLLFRFVLGGLLIILGLSIFLVGVDIGVTPLGSLIGTTLAKSNKVWIFTFASLILGFFISIAEPDLQVLAGQVALVTAGTVSKMSIVTIVSVGIAIMLTIGLLRIVYNKALPQMLTIFYLIIFGLACFTSKEFLAIAFDASGATTGAMTVPFMLALALGVSSLKKDGKASEEDSFGLVGIVSTGAIWPVMVMSIFSQSDRISGSLEYQVSQSAAVLLPFMQQAPKVLGEVCLALLPLIVTFFVFQFFKFKLSKKALLKIIKGLLYTLIGLVLFLTGVNAGFMDVGSVVGYKLASLDQPWLVTLVGFTLGLTVVLAEPAVYVLTHQIETVTSGSIQRKLVLVALSIGVGFAVSLSMIRILIPEIQLWHYLLPGFLISILMAYYAPKLFVGIAFDAGGVASGPMTATFILAFVQGVAEATAGANVLAEGFGMISMVALTPIIALLILGLIYKNKSTKGGLNANEPLL
ncbi:MAG TPA: DUF1538 domain-containing protein [Bacillota bacterium]